MCGIVGYCGGRMASQVLLESLKRLEYRGYDSAGVAIVNGHLELYKERGEISVLESVTPTLEGTTGIGHTRWATCGAPSKSNAHPFISQDGTLALVHNGIIENHIPLRNALQSEGVVFSSDTDTEVLVHLIRKYHEGDLHAAVRRALEDIRGTYAIAVVENHSPDIVVARKESPLVIGVGIGENFVASDVTAMLEYTSDVIYMMDGETAVLTPDSIRIFDGDGVKVERPLSKVDWSLDEARKGGFEHFMLKEIYEQPHSLTETIISYIDDLEDLDVLPSRPIEGMKILACGTSYNAGLVGKYAIEELSGINVQVELASEYRYSTKTNQCPLVVLITQSGETADTLAACREAKLRGCHTLAVTNVVGSSITREADAVLMTRAGPEIGVAATKTYTAQLVTLYMLAALLAYRRRNLGEEGMRTFKESLRSLPNNVAAVLDRATSMSDAAKLFQHAHSAFFIGRNRNFPTMLEGALKLKEISYVHAEGYAAGELKHGPLALLDGDTPLVAACMDDHTYDKMMSNVSEVVARGSPVILLAEDDDMECDSVADLVIRMPPVDPIFTPVTLAVALQLLAYSVAKERGMPIDKPRNLAKSVTVE